MGKKWKDNQGWNKILQGDGFYISYLKVNMEEFGLPNIEETALCYKGNIDILTGDHREAYEARLYDYDECLGYYYSRKNIESSD